MRNSFLVDLDCPLETGNSGMPHGFRVVRSKSMVVVLFVDAL